MSKEVKVLNNFIAGSFCGVDFKDIPDEGFVITENIDPTRKLGAVMPRNSENNFLNTINTSASVVPTSGFQYNDGLADITLLHMDSDDDIYYATTGAYTNIGSLPTGATPSKCIFTSALDGSARVSYDKDYNPKWFGKITRDQYSQTTTAIETDAYQLLDAPLVQPTAGTGVISIAITGTSYFFIMNNDSFLYKWDSSTGLITRSSFQMNHPIKIVHEQTDGYLYVLDDKGGAIYIYDTDMNLLDPVIDLRSEIAAMDADTNPLAHSFDVYRQSGSVHYIIFLWVDDVSLVKTGTGWTGNAGLIEVNLSTEVATGKHSAAYRTTGLNTQTATQYIDGSVDSSGNQIANACYDDIAIMRGYSFVDGVDTKVPYVIAYAHDNGGAVTTQYSHIGTLNLTTEQIAAVANDTFGDNFGIPCGITYLSETGDDGRWAVMYRISSANAGWEYMTGGTYNYFRIQVIQWADVNTGAPTLTVGTQTSPTYTNTLSREILRPMPYSATPGNMTFPMLGAPSVIDITPAWNGVHTYNNQWSFGPTFKIIAGQTVGSIPDNYRSYYKICLIADGFQRTALTISAACYVPVTNPTVDEDFNSYRLKIMIPAAFSSIRWTAIEVYRAESSSESIDVPGGEYQLMKRIRIADDDLTSISSGTSYLYDTSGSLNNYLITTVDQDALSGVTYENVTGMSETIRTTAMRYKYAVNGSNALFVVGCENDELSNDLSRYLFKSNPAAFDTFNWLQNYQKMPINDDPTGIGFYQGRVVVFDPDTMVVVNAETLTVEDIYRGIGCISHHTIVSTKYGLFWADDNHVYQWTGGIPKVISSMVENDNILSTYGWKSFASKGNTSAAFDQKRTQYVLLMGTKTVGSYNEGVVASYTIPQERWDFHRFNTILNNTSATKGVNPNLPLFSGIDGTVIVGLYDSSNNNRLAKMYSSTTAYKFDAAVYTKDFTFGSAQQKVKLNELRYSSTDTDLQASVFYDGAASETALTETAISAGYLYKAALGAYKYSARFKFAFETTPESTDELSEYSIVYRPLVNK